MLSVDDALSKILHGAKSLHSEKIPLSECCGRIIAEGVRAAITQPPFAASAMDGYAVCFSDMAIGNVLSVIGEAPAGAPFSGTINSGEAVRIFTGGVVPSGADHVIIQEDVSRTETEITVTAPQKAPRNIRAAGIDFKSGDLLIREGELLHEIHGSICAAANIAEVSVVRRPRVALFSNGDELVEPGSNLCEGQIVNSNRYALSAMMKNWGADVTYLGCAADCEEALAKMFRRTEGFDIIVPVGGASVGDYDYVKSAFSTSGGQVEFEKIAVRPGKPTWFGHLGGARLVGLPGNPASAIVTAALFVQPLIRRLAGEVWETPFAKASSTLAIAENGSREHYLRAKAIAGSNGYQVMPMPNQDSSLLSPFAEANALIRRSINAAAVKEGDLVDVVWLR